MPSKKKRNSLSRTLDVGANCSKRDKVLANILQMKEALAERRISLDPIELECRLDILNNYIDQVMCLQSEIEDTTPMNDQRFEIESICVSTKSMYISQINKNKKTDILNSTMNGSGHMQQTRLPNMKLDKFSGNYGEYKNFMGLFESLVDSDPCLSDIQKFNHLLTCLTDEALGTVKSFQLCESNYSKALVTLKKSL